MKSINKLQRQTIKCVHNYNTYFKPIYTIIIECKISFFFIFTSDINMYLCNYESMSLNILFTNIVNKIYHVTSDWRILYPLSIFWFLNINTINYIKSTYVVKLYNIQCRIRLNVLHNVKVLTIRWLHFFHEFKQKYFIFEPFLHTIVL